MTDYDFTDVVKFIAGKMSEQNENTYRYQYSYVLPGQLYGAFYGSETLLLFGLGTVMRADPAVVENLVDLWTRFPKTGDPNGGMNNTWLKYNPAEDLYLDIGDIPSVKGGK